MYFGKIKQNGSMYLGRLLIALTLVFPYWAGAQSAEFKEWEENYNDHIWSFEKNLNDELSGKLQQIPDNYFSQDTLPTWMFTWNPSAETGINSVGISDPFTNSEKAYEQAYNRAIFLLSVQIYTSVNGMNELFTKRDDESDYNSSVYTQYYQLFSKSHINQEKVKVVEKTYLKTGECIVKIRYNLDESFDKTFNTYVSVDWYSQEKNMDHAYSDVEKLMSSGNTLSKAGLSGSCAYTYRRIDNKEEVLSECPENYEYYVPFFQYYFESAWRKSSKGLWNSYFHNYIRKIVVASQLAQNTVKNVSDGYQKLENNLARNIVLNQNSFYIARTDSNFNFVLYNEPIADSSIVDIKEGSILEWYPNGVKKRELYYVNDHLDGVQYEWAPNDHLISEINYKSGELEGMYQTWHDNYIPKENAFYKNGKILGEHSKWYYDGRVQLQENYNEEGKQDGKFLEYYEDGSLKNKGKFKNGLKKGWWKSYDENGKKEIDFYKKGKKLF